MKKCIIILSALLLSACESSEIESIKRNLGDYQYVGVDPKLSFTIPLSEFQFSGAENNNPRLNYRINIKQNNDSFPIATYLVGATVEVIDSQGTKRTNFDVRGEIENGVLSVSGVDALYGLEVKDQSELRSLKLRIDSYTWSPKYERKPFQATAEKVK